MRSDEARSEWIRRALRRPGKTQAGLAAALGLDRSQGHRIASGRRPLKAAELPLVERYLGVRAPPFPEDLGRDARPQRGFDVVPVFDPRTQSMGRAPAGPPLFFLPFDADFLAEIASDAGRLFAIAIPDDAAAPHLLAGDHALCDPVLSGDEIRDGLYLLRIGGSFLARWLNANSALKIRGTGSEGIGDIVLAARIVWFGRRLV